MNYVVMTSFDWLVLSVMVTAYFLPSIVGALRGCPTCCGFSC